MVVDVKRALEFVDNVKKAYGAGSPEYLGFLDAMRHFKGGRADSRETHRTIIALFRAHPELIEGYTLFVPPGHTIHIPEDPQGNILVAIPTGTVEIARDGTVVNETHTQALETPVEEAKLPELTGQEKHLLEKLRARIPDSENREEYESFIAMFEANLRISPGERKLDAGQGREVVEKLQGLLGGSDELKRALSEVSN